MRSDPWESRSGVLPGKLEIGVDAEHLERRSAAGIAWVCREQVANRRLIAHLMGSALTSASAACSVGHSGPWGASSAEDHGTAFVTEPLSRVDRPLRHRPERSR